MIMLFKVFIFLMLSSGFVSKVASANPVNQISPPSAQEPIVFLGDCKPASNEEEAAARKLAEQARLSRE